MNSVDTGFKRTARSSRESRGHPPSISPIPSKVHAFHEWRRGWKRTDTSAAHSSCVHQKTACWWSWRKKEGRGGGLTLKPHGITRSNASMCARCENACISRILRFLVLLHLSCSRLSFFFTVEPLVDRDACSPSCFVSSQRSRINFRATRNCRGVEPCPWVSYSHPPSHTTTLTCCLSSSLKRKIIYRVDVNAVSV